LKNSSDKRSNYSKPKKQTKATSAKPKTKAQRPAQEKRKAAPVKEQPVAIEPLEEGQDFLSGRNPVLEALRSGREMNKLFLQEGQQKGPLAVIHAMAQEAGIQIQLVPRSRLTGLAGTENHQGVGAAVAAYEYAEMEDIFELARQKDETPLLILLDELEDPHNLGSILRTADAVGAHGIIIPKRRSVGLTQVVAKASTGAIEHIPVVRVTNLARTMEDLKKQGIWFVGTNARESDDYRTLDGTMPLGIVIGSEGKGMSRLVREKCDFLVHLPMAGHVTSLNASVAASLLLYEVYRTRKPYAR
jgi:23S rRNA (guanosine2251-2'-O)-methyltransferase